MSHRVRIYRVSHLHSMIRVGRVRLLLSGNQVRSIALRATTDPQASCAALKGLALAN